MKKNVREHKNVGVQFAYVLDCIYNDEKDNMSDKEAINYFFECFNKEYNNNYNKRLYPNLQERISQYIQGLPTCISIAFTDYDIINIGKTWGYCENGGKECAFINNWFSVIAWRLIQLKDKLNK